MESAKRRKKNSPSAIVFYCIIVVPAVIQVLIFFFYANLNSILLAFKSYDPEKGFYFSGFRTYKELLSELFASGTGGMWRRSFLLYMIGYFTTIVNLAISFFLYKKIPCSGAFKILLFLPSVLPGMAMVLFYKNFTELTISPTIISSPETAFKMLVLYGLWIGFGGSMVMYLGMFARIEQELIDAMEIDGGTLWTEFIHLAWPKVYPIVTIGIYTGLGTIFSGSPNTYMFFGNNAPKETWTIGYYMYAKVVGMSGASAYSNYAVTSAANLMFGLIVLFPSMFLKRFFESRDPLN